MIILRISALLVVSLLPSIAESLDLSGEWKFALDPQDQGIRQAPAHWKFPVTIRLPGILTAQGFGEKPSIRTEWTGDGWKDRSLFLEWQADENFKMPFMLTPPRHYVGPAWYQREVEIPTGWKDKDLRILLERVHWQSTLWIDGKQVGASDTLGTPHVFQIALLEPGRRTLTLRVDNRINEINPGPLAHSITDHTQGNWNGVVGGMHIEALPANRIDSLTIHPSNDGTVRVVVAGSASQACRLNIAATPKDGGDGDHVLAKGMEIPAGPFRQEIEGSFGNMPIRHWSEFDPVLYQVNATLSGNSDEIHHRHTETFGFREIANREGILTLNGRRVFMRGTLECAIFPRLGHPPTDIESWKRIIRICKDHGLNHIRFHSWCPPKAAFIAADELGIYLQPEASVWANKASMIGSGLPVDAWVDAETDRMLAHYGNHPSFLFMASGNEPGGPNHKEWLADWVRRQQEKDPRRLYTTAAGWPVMEGSGYHLPTNSRIQAWGEGLKSLINAKSPETRFDWSAITNQHPKTPIMAHEIGQWCAYPNFDEIKKYDGYFQARNFEIFRKTARRNGLLDQAHDFLMASGKWQAAAYKHDIEAALRTSRFGGFQLLDLHDFPGQGTALVGVLDAFWDSKGYISASEFRRFAGPVVPLARMDKLVFTSDETLEAALELAHFGPRDYEAFVPAWTVTHGGETVASGTLDPRPLAAGDVHPLGNIKVPLEKLPAPGKFVLTVLGGDGEASNAWDFFVFPNENQPAAGEATLTRTLDDTLSALQRGEAVLWLAEPRTLADDPEFPIEIGFSPIFWNTLYTNRQPPHTLGLLNRADHPALAEFPTDSHTNWQWWEIVTRSRPFILTPHHRLKPIVQPIDDWFTNRKLGLVFEAKVGKGRLLACSADLETDAENRPAARQLLVSLRNHAGSGDFLPDVELTPDDLTRLVR